MASAVVGSTAAMVAATAAKSAVSAKTSSAAPSLASPFAGGFASSLATSARKEWESRTTSNGVKVQCMKVWPPYFNQRWETLSYLPQLTPDQMRKQVDYLLREGWVPCLEFDENAYIKRLYNSTPGYYDGRYWTMWKLPMFGCNDSAQVLNEVNECKKEYPKAFIRVIGFDSVRQVQCISFVVHKPF